MVYREAVIEHCLRPISVAKITEIYFTTYIFKCKFILMLAFIIIFSTFIVAILIILCNFAFQ